MYLLHCNARWLCHSDINVGRVAADGSAASSTGRPFCPGPRPCRAVQCSVAQAEKQQGDRAPSRTGSAAKGQGTKQAADIKLPQYQPDSGTVELLVAGAGPSGLAVAERVSQAGDASMVAQHVALASAPEKLVGPHQ